MDGGRLGERAFGSRRLQLGSDAELDAILEELVGALVRGRSRFFAISEPRVQLDQLEVGLGHVAHEAQQHAWRPSSEARSWAFAASLDRRILPQRSISQLIVAPPR